MKYWKINILLKKREREREGGREREIDQLIYYSDLWNKKKHLNFQKNTK